MKMESERKTTTTTTATKTTARRTSKPTSVQKTRIGTGGGKGGRGTSMNVINEREMSSKNHVQVLELPKQLEVASNVKRVTSPSPRSCNSEDITMTIAHHDGQLQAPEQQHLEESCNSDSINSMMLRSNNCSPTKLLKKSRSEPLEPGSSTECLLRKAKSDNWDGHNNVVATQSLEDHDGQQQGLRDKDMGSEEFRDQMVDYRPSKEALEERKEEVEELSSSAFGDVNVCETEEKVEASSEEQNVINNTCDCVDNGDGVENENESEQNKLIDKAGDDQLNEVDVSQKVEQIKSKKMLSSSVIKLNPASTPIATATPPSTSTEGKIKPVSFGRRSIPRTTSSSPSPQSITRKAAFQYRNSNTSSSKCPESHGKLQFLVDLVMWRDVSRSAFIFGSGTFIILSSSYAEDFNFSIISVVSYMTLVYLAIMFLCKSIVNRGAIEDGEILSDNYIWGEDEAIWFANMVLPYLNESFLKLRVLFSGDPAMTMKVSTLLFILARCGSSITVWKMVKLGFFGVFIIPKLCSSYSTQIIAYGNFWIVRFQDAWKSCLHKRALVFVVFTVVWNFSSIFARAWTAFMMFVAFRYYHHQYIMSNGHITEEQFGFSKVRVQRNSDKYRCEASTSSSTSLYQNKDKKSF